MTARAISHYQPAWVQHAKDIPAVSIAPRLGGWILFRAGRVYGEHGHAGVVMRIGTSTVTIVEGNYRKNQITVREIRLDDPEVRGYFP